MLLGREAIIIIIIFLTVQLGSHYITPLIVLDNFGACLHFLPEISEDTQQDFNAARATHRNIQYVVPPQFLF